MRSAVRRRIAIPAAVTTGVLVSGLLVWNTSYAAFTANTTNPTNKFASANVNITTTSSGSALFNASNLVPGSTGTQCVDVFYNGTTAATVKLSAAYDATDPSSTLAQFLTFTIDEVATSGSVSSASDCAGDAIVTNIDAADSTLAAKVATLSATPSNLNNWTPSSSATKRYRFTYTLQDNSAAQNQTAKVGFTWTAQSVAGS